MHRGIAIVAPPRVSTRTFAFVGVTVFISGCFVLAAAGRAYGPATLALILAGAMLLALPLGVLTQAIAFTEGLTGRAWGAGFRRLTPPQRTSRAAVGRGLRYAGVLWLANGLALWFATAVSLAGG